MRFWQRISTNFSSGGIPENAVLRQSHQGCGSGFVLGIRIPDPDPGARKLRNFSGKMHFLVIFFNFTTKKVKIALTTF
jgi:hypothetical protein